jgi:peptide/nickel transport system substrate-binding protein
MFKKSLFLKFIVLVTIASLALSACGGVGGGATSAPKVATLIFTQEPDTMNPLYTNMYYSTILHQVWNLWAWQYDDQNKPYPVLVKELPNMENGGISADGKVLTLKLRDDLVWSDGTPMTSADFKFTYDMYVSKKNAVSTTYPYDQIASLETPDKLTVVVTFNAPFAPWLQLFHGILPEHVLKPVFDKDGNLDNAAWNKAPSVGIGPYKFDKWESGSYLRFVRNDKFFGTKPVLDQIFIKIVPDDAAQVAALKAGDGDLGIFIAYPDIPALETAGVSIVTVQSGYSEGWFISMGPKAHPALQDVRVRQALVYAVDREKIAKDLLLGKTKPGASLWDNTPYVDPTLKPYPFDPEKAKALLDEAGWKMGADGVREKDGVKLSLRYGTTTKEVRQSTQAVVQQMLAAVGVKTELLNYDSDIFFASYADKGPAYTGELDIMEWSDVTQFPDPNFTYFLCSEIPSDESPRGVNAQYLCDKELDGLFQQQATQVDTAARIATFQKISKIVFDQVYWASLWQDPDIWAVGKRLNNVKLSGATPFYSVGEWSLK